MKNTIKLSGIITFICAIILCLSGCFSPYQGEGSSITISFGSSARTAAWPSATDNGLLPALKHRIKLTDSNGTKRNASAEGGRSAKIYVAPGEWHVEVEDWFGDFLFATGSSVDPIVVKTGQSNMVNISMTQAFTATGSFAVSNLTDWDDARGSMTVPGNYYIFLAGDISGVSATAAGTNTFNSGAIVTILGNKTITLSGTGSLLRIGGGQTVTIKDVKLKRQRTSVMNTTSLVYISGGEFVMETGSSISGNTSSTDNVGGGVHINGGTLTMNGGAISGNKVENGGGVFLENGTFNMNGGTISGNIGTYNAGGVLIKNSGIFTMTGGTISGNKANSLSISGVYGVTGGLGGGVFVEGSGTFALKGGTVYGNESATAITLRNEAYDDGAALYVTPTGGAAATWGIGTTLDTTNNTIIVVNGNRLQ